MAFMELYIYPKGATYSCECAKCGATMYSHEWIDDDHNERRDAMEAGMLRCDECNGRADPETFTNLPNQYAGRYSADGYMDCTEWHYDSNKRRLERELRNMYGEEE
jgi:hypothetical protein